MPGLSSKVSCSNLTRANEELIAKQIGSVATNALDLMRELLEVFESQPHDEDAARDRATMEHLYSGKEFYDDVHGQWLDKDRAIEARRLENQSPPVLTWPKVSSKKAPWRPPGWPWAALGRRG